MKDQATEQGVTADAPQPLDVFSRALNSLIDEAGAAAYLACLQEGRKVHRTRRLGMKREAYSSEYAKAARDAVVEHLWSPNFRFILEAGVLAYRDPA